MKKYVSLTLVLTLLLVLFAGCGANSSAPMADYAVKEEAMAEAPMMQASGNSLTSSDAKESSEVPENRKFIITVDMSAETEAMDTLLVHLDKKIAALNGFVEGQNIYNGSNYSSRRYRSASLTVRIPADDVDQFTEEVSGIANVVRTNKNLEDVTLQYSDTENRVKALETEQERLLELMEMAENLSDLLEIEARLTDVRYELESYSSQLRLYDNQIDYATIYLNIEEVQEYTPVVEKTTWERIRDGFLSSLEGLGNGVKEVFIWVLANSPYLVVFGIFGFGIVTVLKKRQVRKAEKKQKPIVKSEPEKKEE